MFGETCDRFKPEDVSSSDSDDDKKKKGGNPCGMRKRRKLTNKEKE